MIESVKKQKQCHTFYLVKKLLISLAWIATKLLYQVIFYCMLWKLEKLGRDPGNFIAILILYPNLSLTHQDYVCLLYIYIDCIYIIDNIPLYIARFAMVGSNIWYIDRLDTFCLFTTKMEQCTNILCITICGEFNCFDYIICI